MIWALPILIGGGLLFSQKPVRDKAAQMFGPFLTKGPPTRESIDARAWQLVRDMLIKEEGYENVVYLDSRGFPTVGIGHLVLPEDNLKLGDRISDARIEQLFQRDAQKAFDAAKSQAIDLGRYEPNFIAALTEVNFQLGTGWPRVFANTYTALRSGEWRKAINNIKSSAWAKQTPKRVANFAAAIERAYAGFA